MGILVPVYSNPHRIQESFIKTIVIMQQNLTFSRRLSDAKRHKVSVYRWQYLSLLIFFFVCFSFQQAYSQTGGATCNCNEFIYLDEPVSGEIHKLKVGTGVGLTEVTGANGGSVWMPGGNPLFPSPHGVATDLNGFLYIGGSSGGPIQRLNCDGVVDPKYTPINLSGGAATNSIFSIGNIIYTNGNGVNAFNSCDGTKLGKLCFTDTDPGGLFGGGGGPINLDWNWGISYNKNTQMGYATGRIGTRQMVWAFSKAQLDAGVAGGACIKFLIDQGNGEPSVGDKLLPPLANDILGITSDNSGNIYVVVALGIYKYDANGGFIAKLKTPARISAAMGIVWSETTNRLYVSNYANWPDQDCVGAFDASTLAYLGTALPNPVDGQNNTAKAIGIIKECCPQNLPASFTREVCGGSGTKFYLNEEAFKSCDGIVCGSSWVPVGTPQNMTFDPCDNSVTVTGIGCATFTLNIGAVTSTGCAAQTSTFTICNVAPPAIKGVFTKTPATCTGTTDNNNGKITLTSANAIYNKFRLKTGTGAWSGDTTYATATSLGTLPKDLVTNGPNAGATYSVRFYNSDGCYRDTTVTLAPKSCTCTNPVVTVSPKTQKICTGGTPSAFVANSTTAGLTYQWYGPLADTTSGLGTGISGQLNASYTPTVTAAGKYYYAVVGTASASCSGTAYVSLEISAKPTLSVTSTNCNVNGLTFDVITSTNGNLTADKGTVSGSSVTGVPAGQTVTITASLNGCTTTATATKTCAIPCTVPNCSTQVTVQKN